MLHLFLYFSLPFVPSRLFLRVPKKYLEVGFSLAGDGRRSDFATSFTYVIISAEFEISS